MLLEVQDLTSLWIFKRDRRRYTQSHCESDMYKWPPANFCERPERTWTLSCTVLCFCLYCKFLRENVLSNVYTSQVTEPLKIHLLQYKRYSKLSEPLPVLVSSYSGLIWAAIVALKELKRSGCVKWTNSFFACQALTATTCYLSVGLSTFSKVQVLLHLVECEQRI